MMFLFYSLTYKINLLFLNCARLNNESYDLDLVLTRIDANNRILIFLVKI